MAGKEGVGGGPIGRIGRAARVAGRARRYSSTPPLKVSGPRREDHCPARTTDVARAQARRREYGIRAGLEGGGRRLVRQVLTESVLLSALGIYGTVAYMVGRRSREIGIRPTLGETRASVRVRVIAHAVALATSGVVVGLAGALAGGRWLSTLTPGVEPHDPAALAVTAAFVVALTVVAAAVPAYHASRLDPTIVLRAE